MATGMTVIMQDEVNALITMDLYPLYLNAVREGGFARSRFEGARDMLVQFLTRTGYHRGDQEGREGLTMMINNKLNSMTNTVNAEVGN